VDSPYSDHEPDWLYRRWPVPDRVSDSLRDCGSDTEALARNVDVPVLRQNFKEQLNVQMMHKAGTGLKDNLVQRADDGLRFQNG
jgi:hypothetical protein